MSRNTKALLISAAWTVGALAWFFAVLFFVQWFGAAVAVESWGWTSANAQALSAFLFFLLLIGVPVVAYKAWYEAI